MRTSFKFLSSLIVLGVISTGAFLLSSAYFSDTETSTANTFQAGELDLKVDNTSYYNGATSSATTWEMDDLPGHLFFDFNDLKPGDWGEDTISLHVQNPAWACLKLTSTKNDDATCTEPELQPGAGNDPSCTEPDEDLFDGELGKFVSIIFWPDDGDNVLETNEFPKILTKKGPLNNVFDSQTITLADSTGSIWPTPGPLPANVTVYLAKAWCFGIMGTTPVPQGQGVDPTVASGITCDGAPLNNAAQTDIFTGDFEFTAVQSRHNPDFRCDGEQVSPTPSPTPPTNSPTPTPLACQQADVILVLDRSGSIDSTELSQLKTAANDFIDSLELSTLGIHAGMSSFADTGSLDHHLSDDPTSVKTSINALSSSGFTNLKAGLDLATTELANPGDSHDRTDGSSPDKIIVVTDGHPNRPLPSNTADDVAAASADAARAANAEIFVVGVGADVNTSYLQTEIADDASHYYSVSNYSGLQTTLQNLDLCQ